MNPTEFSLQAQLYHHLRNKQPLAIAWSGGLDSTALVLFSHFNRIKYISFTLIGPHITEHELKHILNLRNEKFLKHVFFYADYRFEPRILKNCKRRCYYCKHFLFSKPVQFFAPDFTIIDGTNASDFHDHRPGILSLQELGITSPFADLGIGKRQIMELALHLRLDKHPHESRSCILTRFEYGIPLDDLLVAKIRAVEDYLLENRIIGFRFRMLRTNYFILQIADNQQKHFYDIREGLEEMITSLGLFPYEVHFLAYDRITGFFDQEKNGRQ